MENYIPTNDFTTEDIMEMIDISVESQLKGVPSILYFESPPGIGKTQMVLAYAEWKRDKGSIALGLTCPRVLVRTIILSQSDSVDFGAPAPDFDNGTLDFLVPGDILGTAPGDEDYDIVLPFWDELPNSSPATMSSWQSIVESGEIRGRKKSPHCVYIAAGNRPEDKCGARPLPRSVREGRIITVGMGVSMPRLIEHARVDGWDVRLINMLRWSEHVSKDMLGRFDPNTKSKVQPSPRGLQKLNSVLCESPSRKILDVLAPGCVGDRMWAEIRAFFAMSDDLASVREIIDDPKGATIPGSKVPEVGPSAQYAVISNCSSYLASIHKEGKHLETRDADSLITYFKRMPHDEMTLFGFKACEDAHPEFKDVKSYGEARVEYKELTIG